MNPFPLVVLLTLAAGPGRTIPAGCREDYETCREDCTIDYGGGTTKYRQLGECLHRCDEEQKECTSQHYSLRDSNVDPLPARERNPAQREPETDDAPGSDTPASALSTGAPRDTVRRAEAESGMTEEPESETRPTPKPERAVEPASAKREDMRVFDEPEAEPAPAPKPAPKPAEPLHPKPPAEPKKKDISDWDPNGD